MNCQGCGAPLEPSRGHRPRKWCSERCRKAQYDFACEDCGGRVNGTTPSRGATRCPKCAAKRRGERERTEHRAFIEAMWADGLTAREIAVIAGWTHKSPNGNIVNLRVRGYDLPHRYSPERVARITAGSSERLAKARAVYRESRAA